MNVNLYLPDDLGERAKQAELPLSQLLRAAVTLELERQATMAETLSEAREYLLDVRDVEGRAYTGRLTGTLVANEYPLQVYLTTDGRLIAYDVIQGDTWPIDDVERVRGRLSDGAFADVLRAIGEKPIIDL